MYPSNQAAPQTQAMAFVMNEASALEAGVVAYINDTGAYTAEIDLAHYIQAGTGAHGLKINFTVGNKAGSLILNYQKANGEKIFGADFINAILFISGVKGFTWSPAVDREGKPVQAAAELARVKVGLVVESVKNQTGGGYHLELRQVYCPITMRTSTEIKNNEAPTAVEALLKRINK